LDKTPKKSKLKYFTSIDMGSGLMDHVNFNLGDGSGFFPTLSDTKKLFLNMYTSEHLFSIMQDVGMVEHLYGRGFKDLIIDLHIDDMRIHYLKVYNKTIDPDTQLIDLRLSDTRFIPDKKFFDDDQNPLTLDMFVIEWLSIQNPDNLIFNDRPQLPGQSKPGLGCLKFMMKMMFIVAEGVVKDGFLDVPDHLHGAIMYSKTFKFFDPAHEAILRAIVRDLSSRYSLADLSWGMLTGTIYDKKTGNTQAYDPSEQIFPVSKRLRDYFKSNKYKSRYSVVYKKKKYIFDYTKMCDIRDKKFTGKNPAEL
jgi:hypothetical protein